MDKKIIQTVNAPQAIGPYSQAVEIGNTIYLSGQIAINPQEGTMILSDITSETHQVMKNILAVLNEAGCTFDNVVKTTIFLSNMTYFDEMNKVYATYFNAHYPARETVAVAGLPRNVNVEISMIAYK
jgi:2-iminobutanoate/2-iminopropanoate deaminase